MPVIHKYPFELALRPVLMLPQGARVLSVQMQADVPTLWAVVDPAAPLEPAVLVVLGTGWEFPGDGPSLAHLGTVQDGPYVWHVFGPESLRFNPAGGQS